MYGTLTYLLYLAKTVFVLSLHFVPRLRSAVCILFLVCFFYPVCSLQSAFLYWPNNLFLSRETWVWCNTKPKAISGDIRNFSRTQQFKLKAYVPEKIRFTFSSVKVYIEVCFISRLTQLLPIEIHAARELLTWFDYSCFPVLWFCSYS